MDRKNALITDPARPAFHIHSTGWRRRLNPVEWAGATALSLALFAASALAAPKPEVAEDIRDVKGFVEIPQPPNYALWIAIALGVLVLGLILWKLLTRPKKSPSFTAAELALSEIEQARALIGEESPEPLANAVTGAVRRYLDGRFGIAAPRRTTEEFLRGVHAQRHPEILPYTEDLGRFLRFCDEVKFGREEVVAANRAKLIESARRFVEASNAPPTAADTEEAAEPPNTSPSSPAVPA